MRNNSLHCREAPFRPARLEATERALRRLILHTSKTLQISKPLRIRCNLVTRKRKIQRRNSKALSFPRSRQISRACSKRGSNSLAWVRRKGSLVLVQARNSARWGRSRGNLGWPARSNTATLGWQARPQHSKGRSSSLPQARLHNKRSSRVLLLSQINSSSSSLTLSKSRSFWPISQKEPARYLALLRHRRSRVVSFRHEAGASNARKGGLSPPRKAARSIPNLPAKALQMAAPLRGWAPLGGFCLGPCQVPLLALRWVILTSNSTIPLRRGLRQSLSLTRITTIYFLKRCSNTKSQL